MSDYRTLGPIELRTDALTAIALEEPALTALLAMLLLARNAPVPIDRLVAAVGAVRGQEPTPRELAALTRELRKKLALSGAAPTALTRARRSCQLEVDPGALDLVRFEQLLEDGRAFLADGDAQTAAQRLRGALALWRGTALAELAANPFFAAEAAGLEELRLQATEERVDAELALGLERYLIDELPVLVDAHPRRPRLVGQQMLALYRVGQPQAALAAYGRHRQLLEQQAGPRATLGRLAAAIEASRAPDPALRRQAVQLAFLFTDIEGSTNLLNELGEGYVQLLVTHRTLLAQTFAAEKGRVVDSVGDAFFVSFQSVADAVRAAVAAQSRLFELAEDGSHGVRVRIGIHFGEAVPVSDGLVGLDVHRAARIAAAAHGGQVLLSDVAREALVGAEPQGVHTINLGEVSLKDLVRPERIHQLVIEGLPATFPPLRAAPAPGSPTVPERAILLALGEDTAEPLLAIAEPLAASSLPHALLLVSLLEHTGEGDGRLERANAELQAVRDRLAGRVATSVAAFTSAAVGNDVVRLAREHSIDLVLARPATEIPLRGAFSEELRLMLEHVPCDLALLTAEQPAVFDHGRPIVVPFGGSQHDWASLELAAWLAAAADVPLRMLGRRRASPDEQGGSDPSRLLATASLAVQHLIGIPTEPRLVEAGAAGILEETRGASLLVCGLSERWPAEGLGAFRTRLVLESEAPLLLVRRGGRPGALGRGSATRYAWSLPSGERVGRGASGS